MSLFRSWNSSDSGRVDSLLLSRDEQAAMSGHSVLTLMRYMLLPDSFRRARDLPETSAGLGSEPGLGPLLTYLESMLLGPCRLCYQVSFTRLFGVTGFTGPHKMIL